MSDNPKETLYYLRIISMYMDLGTELLLEVFIKLIPAGKDVSAFLGDTALIKQLKVLFTKKVLNKSEYYLVIQKNAKDFDISLLIKLIIEFHKTQLPKPQLGWDKPPHSKDVSVGADILRLRRIRNELIGHRPNAKITEQYYEHLLKQIKDVLGRVAANVVPHLKIQLNEKIESYENAELEYTSDPSQKRLLEIQTWFDEFKNNLQEKVEALIKQSKEFELYLKRKPVRYCRYIGLLFEGGCLVLSEILLRELENARKDLQGVVKDKSHLFGETHTPSLNPCSWDISVLVSLIFEVAESNLRSADKKKIQSIGDARQNYAETALASLNEKDFFPIWTDLVCNLTALSTRLSDEVVEKCERLIEKYKSAPGEMLDTDSYLNQLKTSGVQIKTLEDVYKETKNKLKESCQQMAESGMQFSSDKVLDFKMVVECKNEEVKRAAEDDIETVYMAALSSSDSPPEHTNIRLEADALLKRMSLIPDIKVTEVKRKCILMSVQISSFAGVLGFINFMQGEECQHHLENLSTLMSIAYNEACVVLGNITLEGLLSVNDNACDGHDISEPALVLPIICSSAKGMKQAYELLSCEDTTNLFNKMAETLTQQGDSIIEVKARPDLHELCGVFDRSDSTKSESSGCSTDDDIDYHLLPKEVGTHTLQRTAVTVEMSRQDEQSSGSTEESEEVRGRDATSRDHHQSELNENETNEIYRHLREVKSRSIQQSSDSGFCSDAVSSIAGRSNTSEGYDEYMEGRFEPVVGTCVDIATKGDISVSSSTVGPVVTLAGYDEKCFITTGDNLTDIEDFTVNGRNEMLKVLAHNPNDSAILIAPVCKDLFIEPQIEEVIDVTESFKMYELQDLVGQPVFKFGAKTGLTEGIITGMGDARLQGPGSVPQNVLLVESLAGSPDGISFAKNGDAGALVIHQGFTKSWSCVGVLLGTKQTLGLGEELFIVRPMKDILEDLQRYIGMSIVVDKAFMDPQVSAILEKVKK